jgi:CheY-like chemotaxis protein
MVIDDQATSREILQRLLQTWRLTVETVACGEEALRRIAAAEALRVISPRSRQ